MITSDDLTECQQGHDTLPVCSDLVDNIISNLREPFLVLNRDLRVEAANRSFLESFHVSNEEVQNCLVYDLGDGQWDNPRLRTLLHDVLIKSEPIHDFKIDHCFPNIGRRDLLVNARKVSPESNSPPLILLAIEDVTDRQQTEAALRDSEIRYRRLFEAAKDGILILDALELKIIDSNPFMTHLLGYSHDEFLGMELWEIGLFADKEASQSAYRELQKKGFIRYDHLPLETRTGQKVEVEFVSNIYAENRRQVVQCNIRDISKRRGLERQMHEHAAALADLDHRKDARGLANGG